MRNEMSDKWKTKFKLLAEEVYGVDGNFDEITFNKKEIGKTSSVLICMNPAFKYKVYLNGTEFESNEIYPGTLNINIPRNKLNCILKVEKE